MALPTLCLLLAAALATGSYFAWQAFTRREVARNLADILADGSNDSLRKGYHQRRTWVRFWVWGGLCWATNLPLVLVGLWPALLGFAALGLLLAGYFACKFNRELNLARGLPELHASFDSASWPDAAVVKKIRATAAAYPQSYAARDPQGEADHALGLLLLQVWFWCRLGCGVLALASIILSISHAKG